MNLLFNSYRKLETEVININITDVILIFAHVINLTGDLHSFTYLSVTFIYHFIST
jgi:hypothetical protein